VALRALAACLSADALDDANRSAGEALDLNRALLVVHVCQFIGRVATLDEFSSLLEGCDRVRPEPVM
jgi:hypothetical protein